jgi:peptidoglycan DL-endopeptidase CwlO
VSRSISALAPALLAVALAALVAASAATAEPAAVSSKRAEAQRVLAQVQELDAEVGRAAEAYNLANLELKRIRAEQKLTQSRLVFARANLRQANKLLEERVVALYTADTAAAPTIEVILGARTLEDLVTQIETVERVSAQDAEVLRQVSSFRSQVEKRKQELARTRAQQAEIVARRQARKAQIERRLAERQRLLAGIRSEVARLEAEERRRQEAAAREARRRIAASRRAYSNSAPATPAAAPAGVAEASSPAQEATTAGPSRYGGVVGIAMRYLGVPYLWGGASPSGFDCSGLVMYAYAQVGVSLPHSTYALWGMGSPVSRGALQPGDLVFFNGLGHMGIYIGGGQFIHAPRTGDVVKISPISGWYSERWVGARRL